MQKDSSPYAIVSVFLFGTVLGGLIALLVGTDDQGELHPKLKEKLKKAKGKMLEGEGWVQDMAQTAGGSITGAFKKAQDKVRTEVAMMRERFGEVDKSKYGQAVGEIVDQMKEVGEVTADQAKVISKYLLDDYQTLATPAPKRAGRKPKKQ